MDFLKNLFLNQNRYRTHNEAIIISCYFNPQNNPYRKIAFDKFYDEIKHLNHYIVEAVIGQSKPQLTESPYIHTIYTESLLWHKESILNSIISNLPTKYKYVFWIDADVTFTNKNWLVDGVAELQYNNIIQPFEYCIHLEKDEKYPSFDLEEEKRNVFQPGRQNPRLWRSFSANYDRNPRIANSANYNFHGHVGFAWGARRDCLGIMEVLGYPYLYDKALIGGADHIMAHAAAGQINHYCITKSFTDDLKPIENWSRAFYDVMKGRIGYVKGDLYHTWHGDLEKRQYLSRIQTHTKTNKQITKKDHNGLYVTNNDNHMRQYFNQRENIIDDGFVQDDTIIDDIIQSDIIIQSFDDVLNLDTICQDDNQPQNDPMAFDNAYYIESKPDVKDMMPDLPDTKSDDIPADFNPITEHSEIPDNNFDQNENFS